jgi:hypothetical protein
MINVEGNKWVPSEGFKYISNGEIWTDSIQLGRTDSINNWYDTNDEPPVEDEDVPDAEALEILLGGAV